MKKVLLILWSLPLFAEIDIVYHLGIINNWREIFLEQLDALHQSGLAQACDSMTIIVLGERFRSVKNIISEWPYKDKTTLIHAGTNLHLYEFPSIEKVIEIAFQKPNTHILYFHSKGVTNYGKPTQAACNSWRRFMEYFTIEKWRDCVDALETADACGVEWIIRPPSPYFGGNFWWANASYIRTCRLDHNNRFDCENFIGTGLNPVAKSFCQTGALDAIVQQYPPDQFPQYYFSFPGCSENFLNLYNFNLLEEYYHE